MNRVRNHITYIQKAEPVVKAAAEIKVEIEDDLKKNDVSAEKTEDVVKKNISKKVKINDEGNV